MSRYYRGTVVKTTEIYDADGKLTGSEVITTDYDVDAVDTLEEVDNSRYDDDDDDEDEELECDGDCENCEHGADPVEELAQKIAALVYHQ